MSHLGCSEGARDVSLARACFLPVACTLFHEKMSDVSKGDRAVRGGE
jgi:hypothetical protein